MIIDNSNTMKYHPKYYYDQLMAEDDTTFSIYLNSSRPTWDEEGNPTDSYSWNKNYKSIYSEEILRGVISQDAKMGSQILWNGSPLNLTSAWANLATNLKNASRNLTNAAHNISNIPEKLLRSEGILNWDQTAYYSLNEFQKTFGGMTTSTPLAVSSIILPYMKGGSYISVKDQLNKFLSVIYENESKDDKDILNKVQESSGSKDGFLTKLFELVTGALASGLEWFSGVVNKFTEIASGDSEKYVLSLKPPHGYQGVPTTFLEGQWMPNTLALRIGGRILYNLLISTITVTVSKEMTYYSAKDTTNPAQAQIDLSFQPVLMIKPSEIKDYILMGTK